MEVDKAFIESPLWLALEFTMTHTFARTSLRTGHAALALVAGLVASSAQAQLRPDQHASLWPQWEGRIGLVLSDASTPLNNPFAFGDHPSSGLKLQSAHVLSDYVMPRGFRATLGLIRGATNAPFVDSPLDGGLNIGARQVEGDPHAAANADTQTVPYVGAGYTATLTEPSGAGTWRFNADLGLISLNSQNIGRVTRILQGEQGVDELVRELRLRPVIKFTVKYAF